jgi:succinoglycan biosynthesis protein ExoW
MTAAIAVIIPFYQRTPGLLRAAVLSALHQRGALTIQAIVVDDGSPVPARDELSGLELEPGRCITLIEQQNAGCYPASNTGLEAVPSNTDFVAFLDSDDVWSDRHLERAVWALGQGYDFYFSDFFQLNQTVTAFSRARRIFVPDHPRIHPTEPIHEYRGDMTEQILTGNILGTSTIVYRRDRFSKLRYRSGFTHTGAEYLFWLELARGSRKIAFSSAPECRYGGGVNIFADSGWGTDKYLRIRQDEIAWKKYALQELLLQPSVVSTVKRRIHESRMNFALGLVHNLLHNRKVSRSIVVRQLRLDPLTFAMVPAAVLSAARRKFWPWSTDEAASLRISSGP